MSLNHVNEGIVKYTAEHRFSLAVKTPHWEELNETRTLLYRLGLIGVYGNGTGYGNLSVRFENNGFLISGTATGTMPVLAAEDYCLVESFDIARNKVITRGPVEASSESMTHGAVYESRCAVNCVIHIHSRAVFDCMLRDNYPSTPESAAYGTPEIAAATGELVREAGRDEGQIVLAGHDEGIVAYGANIEKALNLILELNKKYGV